ncbi:MAG: glycosyltransferase family 1 protein [Planctomycetes bacterium]|nr:glycosyltransferase family 1 protein [Planctomycetota bacterium]
MAALTVALDYRPALHHAFGIGRYVQNLVPALLEADPELRLKLYGVFLRGRRERIAAHHFPESSRASFHGAAIPARLVPWLARVLPIDVASFTGPFDLFHDTDYISTPVKNRPRVATLYDTAWTAQRGFVSPEQSRHMGAAVRRIVAGVKRIITISNFAKQELMEELGLPDELIDVAPLGVDAVFRAPQDAAATARVQQRIGIEAPYGVFVGTLEPRKNVIRLLRGFARLQEVSPEQRLLLVGRAGHGCERIFEEIRRLRLERSVVRTGVLSDAELVPLLHGADYLAYPSLHEGFGLPALEGMAAGVPVLSSNTTALQEVCGEGALLVDPADENAIAEGLLRLACDRCEALEIAARGRAHAAAFTWQRCAEATLASYRRALES